MKKKTTLDEKLEKFSLKKKRLKLIKINKTKKIIQAK